MSEQMKLRIVWPIRIVFILFFCSFPAWLLWLWSQGHSLFQALGGHLLTWNELFPVLGFTIAIFGAWQGLFRWLAAPRLEIELHSTAPTPFWPDGYALHHMRVWNHDSPWWLRPFKLRNEGTKLEDFCLEGPI